MRHVLLIPAALIGLLPATGSIPHTRAAERAVAVTFDDLPATPAGTIANDVAHLSELTRKLLNAVRKYGVPAVGFVNERNLFLKGAGPDDVEGRIGVLRMCRRTAAQTSKSAITGHTLSDYVRPHPDRVSRLRYWFEAALFVISIFSPSY